MKLKVPGKRRGEKKREPSKRTVGVSGKLVTGPTVGGSQIAGGRRPHSTIPKKRGLKMRHECRVGDGKAPMPRPKGF